MGVAKKWAWSPEKNWSTIHKVSKLSEVHDPAVRLLSTKKSSGCEIGEFHKKGPISQKKSISQNKFPVFKKFENVKTNLTAGSCTSDNLKTLWMVDRFFSGDHAHFFDTPTFSLFTRVIIF